jgi:hypothetical protein
MTKRKSKPATPIERDDYSAVQTFLKRADHDAEMMKKYLRRWADEKSPDDLPGLRRYAST